MMKPPLALCVLKILIVNPLSAPFQYLGNRIEDFAPATPVLKADEARVTAFKGAILTSNQRPLRIGISWRGGGRSDRIKLKSMDAQMFAGLMRDRPDQVIFVDLQYGDVRSVNANWKSQAYLLCMSQALTRSKIWKVAESGGVM